MKARVFVTLKPGVLDPQGAAIGQALGTLGFEGVNAVRQGKVFDIDLEATEEAAARSQVDAMADKLLANGVIERYEVELIAR